MKKIKIQTNFYVFLCIFFSKNVFLRFFRNFIKKFLTDLLFSILILFFFLISYCIFTHVKLYKFDPERLKTLNIFMKLEHQRKEKKEYNNMT